MLVTKLVTIQTVYFVNIFLTASEQIKIEGWAISAKSCYKNYQLCVEGDNFTHFRLCIL